MAHEPPATFAVKPNLLETHHNRNSPQERPRWRGRLYPLVRRALIMTDKPCFFSAMPRFPPPRFPSPSYKAKHPPLYHRRSLRAAPNRRTAHFSPQCQPALRPPHSHSSLTTNQRRERDGISSQSQPLTERSPHGRRNSSS